MKKQLLLITFTFCILHFLFFTPKESFGQNPLVKQWDYRFGGTNDEWLTSIEQTKDGGYLLGGHSNSQPGGDKTTLLKGYWDYWIIKLDSLGIKQWDRDFGGLNLEELMSTRQTADAGYIMGGLSFSDSTGDKTQAQWGGGDYWMVKTDSLGIKQWDKDFGGITGEMLYSLQQTTDGGYILGGSSNSDSSGNKTQDNWDPTLQTNDYWVVKTDSLGNKQWDKRFGGTRSDEFTSLQQTTDGGYILGGYSNSGMTGDKSQYSWGGFYDYWVVKIDSLGIKQWDKRFGGTFHDYLYSIQQTGDGGYILGGISVSDSSGDKTQNSWGGWDYWIVKIDSLGSKQWDKRFGGTDSEDEFGTATQTFDGGFLLAGSSYSGISGDKTENNLGTEQTWIVKTDSLGNKEWDKTLQTITTFWIDAIGFAIQTEDNCYAMANFTHAGIGGVKTQDNWDPQHYTADYWIIKFCDTTLTTNLSPTLSKGEGVSIYPNPADELLVIRYPLTEKAEIIIYDISGRTVFQSSIFNLQSSINISSLSPGIYFLKAGNEVKKFVKE